VLWGEGADEAAPEWLLSEAVIAEKTRWQRRAFLQDGRTRIKFASSLPRFAGGPREGWRRRSASLADPRFRGGRKIAREISALSWEVGVDASHGGGCIDQPVEAHRSVAGHPRGTRRPEGGNAPAPRSSRHGRHQAMGAFARRAPVTARSARAPGSGPHRLLSFEDLNGKKKIRRRSAGRRGGKWAKKGSAKSNGGALPPRSRTDGEPRVGMPRVVLRVK